MFSRDLSEHHLCRFGLVYLSWTCFESWRCRKTKVDVGWKRDSGHMWRFVLLSIFSWLLLSSLFLLQDHLACDLIDKLLTLDPSKRWVHSLRRQLKCHFVTLDSWTFSFQAWRRQCAEPRPAVERPNALLPGEDVGQPSPVHVWVQRPHQVPVVNQCLQQRIPMHIWTFLCWSSVWSRCGPVQNSGPYCTALHKFFYQQNCVQKRSSRWDGWGVVACFNTKPEPESEPAATAAATTTAEQDHHQWWLCRQSFLVETIIMETLEPRKDFTHHYEVLVWDKFFCLQAVQ